MKFKTNNKYSLLKFQFDNPFIFVLIFIIILYLLLIYQQSNVSCLLLTSFNDTILNDQISVIAKFIIGISSILYLIFISQDLQDQKLSNFEYSILLLTSIFGFFLLCGVNDLITAYLSIELQGLAFYVLASFKKSSNFSIESGIKYFVLGSLSTAFFLFGITLIYGLSGTILLTDLKDFFIWVFSTNSFFFSFESISEALETFQDKTCTSLDPLSGKLQAMSDKLMFLEDPSGLTDKNLELLSAPEKNYGIQSSYFNESETLNNISKKLSKLYNNLNLIIFNNFLEQTSYTLENNLFRFKALVTFLDFYCLDLKLQASTLETLRFIQDNSLDLNCFLTFKTNLLETYYYEEENLENSLTFLNKNSELGDNFCFETSQATLLQYCYFSEYFSKLLSFYDSMSKLGFDKLDIELHSSIFEMLFVEGVFTGTGISYEFFLNTIANLEFGLCNILVDNSNIIALFNIVNFHSFLSVMHITSSHTESSAVIFFSFTLTGILIVILSLFFKLALAPFHLWSPDVYEGSPSSSTFFFMVISKFGIFVLLLRICYFSFFSFIPYWQFYSLIIATVSIFVGAVGGLKQRRLKSLLTYSSINNMGFVLLAFSTGSFEGVQIKFFYLIVYMLSSICIWSIILNLRLKKKSYNEKNNKELGELSLLHESNSITAQGLGITLFSLAGLPPMVGFLAKMGVFKALNGVSMYYFSIVNILFSVIATFYYLRITKIVFFENILVGNLYLPYLSQKKIFITNLLTFLLLYLFINPASLYLYSYKITLFLNKSFY